MIIKIDEEKFGDEVLNSEKVVVVKLYTQHCSNCKKISEIYKIVSENNLI